MDKRFDGEFDQVKILSKQAADAQKEAAQATAQLSRTRTSYRTLAAACDEAVGVYGSGFRSSFLRHWRPDGERADSFGCGLGLA